MIGDAIYDQDRLLPQIAVGVQVKDNKDDTVIPFLNGALSGRTSAIAVPISTSLPASSSRQKACCQRYRPFHQPVRPPSALKPPGWQALPARV